MQVTGRAAPALLATVFLATSGLAGVAFHLCGMEGLVRLTCCCHKSEHAGDTPPVQLKRIDECCDAAISVDEHPPASAGAVEITVDSPLLVAAAVYAAERCFAPREDQVLSLARGSPPIHGPPLFIWHCSYLN